MSITVRERPPLRHDVQITTPSGRKYRWAPDEPDPANVYSGLRYSDTNPGGFENGGCVLPRKPGISYQDIVPFSTFQVLDAAGEIVGEYRLERAPRTSGDQMSISPGCVGWQAELDDNKSAQMHFVGRDLTQWQPAAAARRLGLDGLSYSVFDGAADSDLDTGVPLLRLQIDGGWVAPNRPDSEAWYDFGGGSGCGYMEYTPSYGASVNTADANWFLGAFTSDDQARTAGDAQTDQFPTATRIAWGPPAVRRYLGVQFVYGVTPGGADGASYLANLGDVVVFGATGLPGYLDADGRLGLLASDIVAYAVARWAPGLTVTTGPSGSVRPSGFVVPHLIFPDPTTVSEMVRGASRFELPFWGVWEKKEFRWDVSRAPRKRWRARTGPAQLQETGPQVDRLWESMLVQCQDVDGSTRTVGPPGSGADVEDARLKDPDPENPANQLGKVRRDLLQIGTATPEAAIKVGQEFLAESKLLDSSGQANLVGWVADDRGVLWPYSHVRSGDDIAFDDAADPSYRRIVRSEKDDFGRACSIDLDAPPEGLEALLQRVNAKLVRLGLS